MALVIAHNIAAINAHRAISASGRDLDKSLARLSSGYRINTGADAPADLSISDQLRAQTLGIERAIRNTTEAANLIGVAEGALNEMNSILKKMKALAIHAANTGITSPEQVAADQAEMDSGIQTLERIAATTAYAGQKLMNGAKELTYSVHTGVKGTQNNSLLDTTGSVFDMISQRDGFQTSISFGGAISADASGVGAVNFTRQAAKAYLEIDTALGSLSQVGTDGGLTSGQAFILAGNKGSRQFTFSQAAHIGDVVSAIHNVSGSTGVDASLVFNSAQTIGAGGAVVRGTSPLLNDSGGNVDYAATGTLNPTGQSVPDLVVLAKPDASGNIHIVDATGTPIVEGVWDGGGTVTLNGNAGMGLYKGLTLSFSSAVSVRNNWSVDQTPKVLTVLSHADFTAGATLTVDASSIGGAGMIRETGTVMVFGNDAAAGTGAARNGISEVQYEGTAELASVIQYGHNTDGQGRIWVKFTGNDSYELYKDESLAKESMVATGISGQPATAVNGSNLEDFILVLASEAGNNLIHQTGVYLAFAGLEGENGIEYSGDLGGGGTQGSASFDKSRTLVSGVELGTNTDSAGTIYTKTVRSGGSVQVFAYRDALMRESDLVAVSGEYDISAMAGGATIILNEIRDQDAGTGTGLGIALSFAEDSFAGASEGTSIGAIRFTNLGARIFSTEYGSDAYIKINQLNGGLFTYYDSPDNPDSARLVEAGTSFSMGGQDATLLVDGRRVTTKGLTLNLATPDIMARLTFKAGNVGSTTLAQVGYGTGSIFTRIGALNLGGGKAETSGKNARLSGLLCNAGHDTALRVGQFQGGMGLQLGDGAGMQERTVLSIKAMSTATLGRTVKGGYWDPATPVWSERAFSLQDVMGGGMASLGARPELTLEVIDAAITTVSETRARLGAVQANLLKTNENNLRVALEKLTNTESAIRDADVALEMVDFTTFQIRQEASTAMLAQANNQAQTVLTLLR